LPEQSTDVPRPNPAQGRQHLAHSAAPINDNVTHFRFVEGTFTL
jgi:hypothetical protein